MYYVNPMLEITWLSETTIPYKDVGVGLVKDSNSNPSTSTPSSDPLQNEKTNQS